MTDDDVLAPGAKVLARLLYGHDVDRAEIEQLDQPWRDTTERIARVMPEQRRKACAKIIQALPNADAVLNAVRRAQDEIRPHLNDAFPCPPLPAHAGIDLSRGRETGQWIDAYVEYATAISPMTPRFFHVSAALWLVSTVIARRLVVEMPFGAVYPNLYVVWIAPTTLFSKTTALDVARAIARRRFPHLLAAQDTTPEALLADMAGEEPANLEKMPQVLVDRWRASRNFAAQRGWLLDELSGLLASAGKDYNAGLLEMLLRAYDCDSEFTRSTRTHGHLVVRNTYLTVLGATTPAALSPHLIHERPWATGLWPRFALLTPENERPEWLVPSGAKEPQVLDEMLAAVDRRLLQPVWPDTVRPVSVPLGKGVSDTFQAYAKAVRYDLLTPELNDRLRGVYGRLPAQVMKVATVLAVLDWAPKEFSLPRIELPHLLRAIEVVEEWRASAHRTLGLTALGEYSGLRERIMKLVVRAEPRGATFRDMVRGMRDVKPGKIREVVEQMVAGGDLRCVDGESGPRGGRPTDRFRVGG